MCERDGKVIGADGGTHLSLGGPPTRPVSLLGEIIFEWDPVPPAPRSPCPPKWPPMKWIDAWRPSYCLILCLVDARWWLIADYFTGYLLEMVSALISKLVVLIWWIDDIAAGPMTRFIWQYIQGKQYNDCIYEKGRNFMHSRFCYLTQLNNQ